MRGRGIVGEETHRKREWRAAAKRQSDVSGLSSADFAGLGLATAQVLPQRGGKALFTLLVLCTHG